MVNVHALVASGVNADGHQEILGLQVTSAEDGTGWLGFFRDVTTRGLTGVALVTSDAHAGLVAAIGATVPGATWQRCRTHWVRKESSCSFGCAVDDLLCASTRMSAGSWRGGSLARLRCWLPSPLRNAHRHADKLIFYRPSESDTSASPHPAGWRRSRRPGRRARRR